MLAERMDIKIERTRKIVFPDGRIENSKYVLVEREMKLGECETLHHVIELLKERYDQILNDVTDTRILVPCALSEMEG